VDITMDDDSYYLGIWYIPPDPTQPEAARTDGLISCWRRSPGAPWETEYRLRCYADDTKQWWTGTYAADCPEADVLAALTLLAGDWGTHVGQAPITVLIQGDGHAAAAALRERLEGYLTFTERPAP
jgi:hypothetical protein